MTIRATYETKNLHYTLNNEKNAYIVDRGMMASETSELYIPCEYSGRPVEEIAERGFYALDLEPEARAIEKIFLPDGLKVIGDFAFTFYSNLSFVSLPDTLAYLGKSAFVSTNLQDITIPKNVNEIGSDAFSGCENLKSVDFQCTSPTMGNSVFDYCSSLISVNLPENLQTIPDYTFRSCRSLPTINIPNRVTAIGKGAFYNCRSLQSVRIPANVAEVGESAFYWCSSLRSVDIATPSKLKTMSKDMFRFCEALLSVNIPNGVTRICDGAFTNCISVPSITIPSTVITIEKNAFASWKKNQTIYVKDLTERPQGWAEIWNNGATVVWNA